MAAVHPGALQKEEEEEVVRPLNNNYAFAIN
jgi:hypothetical protein